MFCLSTSLYNSLDIITRALWVDTPNCGTGLMMGGMTSVMTTIQVIVARLSSTKN
jgi:hypothetical protein